MAESGARARRGEEAAVAIPPAELLRALARARARARREGRPVVVRAPLGAFTGDPWDVLDTLDTEDTPFFAWHDGVGDRTIVAWGVAASAGQPPGQSARDGPALSPADGARPERDLLAIPVDEVGDDTGAPPARAPLWVGGAAFDPDAPAAESAASPWAQWPRRWLFVPQVVLYRDSGDDAGGAAAFAHAAVAADTDLERTARSVERACGALAAVADGRAPARAPTGEGSAPAGHPAQAEHVAHEGEASFRERVRAAREAIAAGALGKVVLARSVTVTDGGGGRFDPVASLRALRREHPSAIAYAVGRGSGEVFLGASPEPLVRVSGRSIETRAIAGTAPRGRTPGEDERLGRALAESAKDGAEHDFVARALKRALGSGCSEVSDTRPRLLRLPGAHHIEAEIRGRLQRPGRILDWVDRLHPTPAVGGFPAAAARAWLRAHEPLARGWYAGPVGWATEAGDGAFAVAIRSGLVSGRAAAAFAGAGIVSESDPESEWRETALKLETLCASLRVKA